MVVEVAKLFAFTQIAILHASKNGGASTSWAGYISRTWLSPQIGDLDDSHHNMGKTIDLHTQYQL